MINRTLHLCSCIIEFIKLVAKKRLNAREASHLISFPQKGGSVSEWLVRVVSALDQKLVT